MPHFFISYAKKDTRQLALQLNDALNALPNITAWVDKSIKAGHSWELQIQNEIDRCDYMIVLYSPDINRHKRGEEESYLLREIHYAKRILRKRIIPVMAQTTEPPMILVMEQYIDFTLPDLHLNDLITFIANEVGIAMKTEFMPSSSPSPIAQNSYLYELRQGTVIFTQNFANTADCAWQGLGGQVFNAEGTPLNGIKIHVTGANIDRTVDSGSNSLYGPGGWEVPVDNKISAQTYYVELLSPGGTVVSARIQVTFPSDCARNLALVNFIQTRIPELTSLDLMPSPFAWIDIPGKGYSIAKYPITNAQFAEFVKEDGYEQRQWWTNAGWEAKLKGWEWDDNQSKWTETNKAWTEPRYWTDANWNGAEKPVVGISWYEAVAFCGWLSEATTENIILPTEDQWQYAAQGEDGRIYPWGNDWDCKRCNNSVKPCESIETTLVWQYEGKGNSPFGVADMAGNVWEWCLTDYDNKTNDIDSFTSKRVLRGGSWSFKDSGGFRCDYRFRITPYGRYDYYGFRIVRS